MYNKYMFQFCRANSLIHQLNPSIKIISFMIIIFIFFLTNNLALVLSSLTLISVLILLSNIPIQFYLKITYLSIYFFMIFVLILALFIELGVVGIIVLKILVILLNTMLIIHTTTIEMITIGAIKVINLFNIFVINVNKLGIIICQFLKFIPIFYQMTYHLLDSGASRGKDYQYTTIIGKSIAFMSAFKAIFILSFRKLKTIGHDMEQRLFLTSKNHLKINFKKIKFNDYFILAIHLLLIVYYIARVR